MVWNVSTAVDVNSSTTGADEKSTSSRVPVPFPFPTRSLALLGSKSLKTSSPPMPGPPKPNPAANARTSSNKDLPSPEAAPVTRTSSSESDDDNRSSFSGTALRFDVDFDFGLLVAGSSRVFFLVFFVCFVLLAIGLMHGVVCRLWNPYASVAACRYLRRSNAFPVLLQWSNYRKQCPRGRPPFNRFTCFAGSPKRLKNLLNFRSYHPYAHSRHRADTCDPMHARIPVSYPRPSRLRSEPCL